MLLVFHFISSCLKWRSEEIREEVEGLQAEWICSKGIIGMYEILKQENIIKILVLLPACPLMTCSNIETKIHVSVCRGVWVYSPTCVHVKARSRHPASSSTALSRLFFFFFETAAPIEL